VVRRLLGQPVSTHASAREATPYAGLGGGEAGRFYPRLREGGDSGVATTIRRSTCFYPRLREGGDGLSAQFAVRVIGFLPTPPRGRRLIRAVNFQSL